MDRRILFILIMSLAVPYGCSMALLGTSLAKSGGLKEQEDWGKFIKPVLKA